jgi:phosphate transport system permease protein
VTSMPVDPRYDITARSAGLGRRRRVEKGAALIAILSALLACAVLFVVLGSVLLKGVSQLDLTFFTKPKPLFGEKGGIADALVGTALMVGMAIAFAVPLAVFVAIYVSEYARPRSARFFRLVLDVLNGVPAIVIGIFVYGLLVVGHGQSAIYASIALAILMLPMVSRATQEVLALVPRSLREASLALGVPRWRTVWSVVLPTATGGILTGVVLAVARVAGETAPILFTSSIAANTISTDVTHALQSLPFSIFVFSESPSPDDQAAGWAAALVLIAFVLVLNVVAKAFAASKRRQLQGSK